MDEFINSGNLITGIAPLIRENRWAENFMIPGVRVLLLGCDHIGK